MKQCIFCEIIAGRQPANVVLEAEDAVAFLDIRPLLPGHVLLAPRVHIETFPALPLPAVGPLFHHAQRLARAVEFGLGAEGSFLAINTKISQSVPHLHIHVVPRRKDDKLFSPKIVWKRKPYATADDAVETAEKIRAALDSL